MHKAHNKRMQTDLLTGALAVLEKEDAASRLWIVEPSRVRIHE